MESASCVFLEPSLNGPCQFFRFQWSTVEVPCSPVKTESTRFTVLHAVIERVLPESIKDYGPEPFSLSSALFLLDSAPDRPVVVEVDPGRNADFRAWIHRVLETCPIREPRAVALAVPRQSGYMSRGDFFEERLRGCPGIHLAQGFTVPRQSIVPPGTSIPETSVIQLAELLHAAVGGIVLGDTDPHSFHVSQRLVQAELENRLSFSWLSAVPISPQRLALVGESRPYNLCARLFHAAAALGLVIVLIDSPGHWLEEDSPANADLLEAFIPIDMTTDPQLPERIVSAIQAYPLPIDGITTVTEFLLIPVSRAAESLSLATSPSTAFTKSVNKYETRLADDSNKSLLISSPEELHYYLSSSSESGEDVLGPDLPLAPWIVKPCNGWHNRESYRLRPSPSEGKTITAEFLDQDDWNSDVLIEEYCRGPEIDANFVLVDGEILFFQVVDNFPCTADNDEQKGPGNFKETTLITPSALPLDEQLELRDSLYRSILRLGYRTGVFHVEARVRNSSWEYRPAEYGGIDLCPRLNDSPKEAASAFLIEINARPPGYLDTCASAFADGVDLFAVQLLLAVQDHDRAAALCTAFQNTTTVILSAVQAEQPGIVLFDRPWEDLKERKPELMAQVINPVVNFRKGDRVADPRLDTTPWLAGFGAYSSEGRTQALLLAEQVKDEFDCKVV